MKDNEDSILLLESIVEGIIKKSYAISFRLILLSPDLKSELTARIRHYDKECEGV